MPWEREIRYRELWEENGRNSKGIGERKRLLT